MLNYDPRDLQCVLDEMVEMVEISPKVPSYSGKKESFPQKLVCTESVPFRQKYYVLIRKEEEDEDEEEEEEVCRRSAFSQNNRLVIGGDVCGTHAIPLNPPKKRTFSQERDPKSSKNLPLKKRLYVDRV